MNDVNAEILRKVISESYDTPKMVGSFIVVAEVIDDDDTALLSWWDGGTQWVRLGMMEWMAQRIRNEVPGLDWKETDD